MSIRVDTPRPGGAVERRRFTATMAAFPTGVAVVAALGNDGQPHGLACSAFVSGSVEPPLVAVALGRSSATLAFVLAARRFGVSFVAAGAHEVVRALAAKGPDKLHGVAWRVEHDVPVLEDSAIAWAACELADASDLGDHLLLVGHVVGASPPDDDAEPLVYFRRRLTAVARGGERIA